MTAVDTFIASVIRGELTVDTTVSAITFLRYLTTASKLCLLPPPSTLQIAV